MSADGPRPRHILVGVDGSAGSRAALLWAAEQAGLTGSPIRAVTVWSPTVVAGGAYGTGFDVVVTVGAMARPPSGDDALRAAAVQVLDDAVAALPPEIGEQVDQRVVPGDAGTVLVEAARDAALLVLGNPGRGALAGAVTGSVALRCAHHAGCPVVLVPERSG